MTYQKFATTVKVDGTIEVGKRLIAGKQLSADIDWEKERMTRMALKPGSSIQSVEKTENTVVVINCGGNVTVYRWLLMPPNLVQTDAELSADLNHSPIAWPDNDGWCGQCGKATTNDLRFHGRLR